jgi:hypothetical protein
MRIFAEIDADQAFAGQLQRARSEVESRDEQFLSQVDDEDYALRILAMVRIDPLRIKFDEAYISTYEKTIPAESHPGNRFFLENGRSYPRQIIRYHVPFEGEADLLRCIPNPRLIWTEEIELGRGEFTFDIVNWGDKADEVKRDAEQIFSDISKQYEHLAKQVDAFNSSAQTQILQLLAGRRAKLKKDSEFVAALGLPTKDAKRSTPASPPSASGRVPTSAPKPIPKATANWDVFISHASEDKDTLVRDLAKALAASGLTVWYDEFTLKVGDSLRRSIDRGLAASRFGIVVLSHNFFSKEWPQRELDGLVAKEVTSGKVILPVWHNITKDEVASYSPILADRLAVQSDKGMAHVVAQILAAVRT